MAALIPDDIINEIRQQTDIVDVISEYVALQNTGQNYKGLCPFHREKTPSFVVSPAKQIYHCYGCGAGGNVFTFLMQHEKYSFPETIRMLARRLGIQLPDNKKDTQTTQQLTRTDVLYQLHRHAARYFLTQLRQSEQANTLRDYLQQRGLNDELIQTFSLGYALPVWDGLRKASIRQYPVELLLESGLLIKRKDGVGQYDRFRDRLMIPIHDDRGRIIAFGGRIIGQGEPKYLNSPESPIFHKAQTLFGLHHAKDAIRKSGYVLIVEGYFDMIIPYSFGIQNIAATMGTALTEQHLRQLQRYTKKVVLIFDSDPAGIKAVLRTLDLFLSSGFEARAVVLPQGEDPDSFIRKAGAERFQTYIEQAPLLLDFVRDRIIERYDVSQLEQQIECANQLLPTIVKIQNPIELQVQIQKTADLLHITDESFLQQFRKVLQARKPRLVRTSPTQAVTIPREEQSLLKAVIKDKKLIAEVRDQLKLEELSHPLIQKVFRELFEYRDKTDFEAKILDTFQGTEGQQELSKLLMQTDDEIVDPAQTVQDCITTLRRKRFERATRNLSIRIREAQGKKSSEGLNELFEKKNQDLLRKKQDFLQKK